MWLFEEGENPSCAASGIEGDVKGATKSPKGPCEPLKLPGVLLKTEKSSAKRGVQSGPGVVEAVFEEFANPILGVSKTGLGKNEVDDVGVCLGVGG